jgi:hypothetical protein
MKKPCIILALLLAVKLNLGAVPQTISSYWEIIAKSSDIHIINSADLKNHLSDMENSVKNKHYYYSIPVFETIKGVKAHNIKFMAYLEQDFVDCVKLLPDNEKLIIFF